MPLRSVNGRSAWSSTGTPTIPPIGRPPPREAAHRSWARQAERDASRWKDTTNFERQWIKAFECKNRKLQQANEILHSEQGSSSYFAQVELDRRSK